MALAMKRTDEEHCAIDRECESDRWASANDSEEACEEDILSHPEIYPGYVKVVIRLASTIYSMFDPHVIPTWNILVCDLPKLFDTPRIMFISPPNVMQPILFHFSERIVWQMARQIAVVVHSHVVLVLLQERHSLQPTTEKTTHGTIA